MKRWRITVLVLGAAALGGFVSAVYAKTVLPRTYTSRATIVFPIADTASAGLLGTMASVVEVPTGSDIPLNAYSAVLTSERALLAVGQRAGIARLYDLTSEAGILGTMRGAVTVSLDINRTMQVSATLPGTPAVRSAGDLFNRNRAAQRDEVYKQMASRVLELLIDEMAVIADEIKLDRAKANVQNLEEWVAQEQAALNRATGELTRFESNLGSVDLSTYAQSVTQLQVEARRNLQTTRAARRDLEEQRKTLQAQIREQVTNVQALADEVPFLKERRKRHLEAQQAFREAERVYGPQSPQVLRAQAELADARREVEQAARSAAHGLTPQVMELDGRLAGLKAKEAAEKAHLKQIQDELRLLPNDLSRLVELQSEAESRRQAVADLRGQLLQARMEYERHGIRWKVLDPPRPPFTKSGPSTVMALLLGALGGGGLMGLWFAPQLYRQLFGV